MVSSNSNKCPKCGSKMINKQKNPTFDGVIVDLKCCECKHEWTYVEDLD